MLRPTQELRDFERRYARRRDTQTYQDALAVFKALWIEACAIRSDFPNADWRRDIAPDLEIARAINGLPPA